ncbi:MAG: NAD-dependent DNA ligase LigA, partial [Clostridia bacterium]
AVIQLNEWAYEYYVLDNPSVSDKHYDALYDRLIIMEKQSGVVLENSPSKRVGGEIVKSFEKYTHRKRLYSLDKVQSFNELENWVEKIKKDRDVVFTVEYKYDGLNLSLTYDKGKLVRAATRGNGEVGEDVTAQVRTIKNVPLEIGIKNLIELQGEGYMKLSALKKYNETHPMDILKNARNGVAGAIRNLDPKVTASRQLSMVFYSIGYSESFEINSQTELVETLKKNGFKTNDLFEKARNYSEIREIIEKVALIRNDLDYLIDGIVIKVDDNNIRNELGYTEKFPKWAVAFKFEAEEVVTKLKKVEWQIGRTGKLTPLAYVEPVELCGATIRKATLNNIGDIERKNLMLNSQVYIRRSNDVIPEILGVAEDSVDSKKIELPKRCPACNSELIVRGAHIYCPNDMRCAPQIIGRLTHYCSKDACDIEGLSDKTITQMAEKLNVTTASRLYELTENDLSKLDGFKDKKIKNILEAIKRSKNVLLPNFIYALGIENVGVKTARDLAKTFKNIDALKNANAQELMNVNEIGETVSESIMEYFSDCLNIELLNKLQEFGLNPILQKQEGVFLGKRFVLTGTLPTLTRSEASKLIENAGGEVLPNVSSNVNILIVGIDAGSKLDKAKKLGIELWNEDELLDKLHLHDR